MLKNNSTYRTCSWERVKTLAGNRDNLFLFIFSTSRELMLPKQPGSSELILLLLRFLKSWAGEYMGNVPKSHTAFCSPTIKISFRHQNISLHRERGNVKQKKRLTKIWAVLGGMIQLSAQKSNWSSDPGFPEMNKAEAVPAPLQWSGYEL